MDIHPWFLDACTLPKLIWFGFTPRELKKLAVNYWYHFLPINGIVSNRRRNYKDKQGRVILKTAYNGTTAYPTYYVYDDFDLLRYVVPPKAVSQLFSDATTSTSSTQLVTTDKTLSTAESGVSTYLVSEGSSLTLSDGFSFTASSSSTLTITSGGQDDDLLYSYRYDGRRRLTGKKIPGAGWQLLAYDSRDRLVLTQDARERARDTTLFRYTLYDTFNRPVQEGLCKEPSGYESVRSNVAGSASYTPSNIQEVLSYTYYDDYDYQSGWGGNTAYTGYDHVYSSSEQAESVKGMVTGTKVRVLGTTGWIYTSTYYDKYGRVIQQNQSNPDGGYSRTSTTYNFTGQPVKQQVVQRQTASAGPVTTETTYAYDHTGRPTTATFSYDGATAVTLSENTYDEIGRLEKKTLHNGNQEADYSYNIRGWLTKINDPDDSYTTGKAFAEELYYNTTGELANLSPLAQYNGNLSGMRWRNDNTTRSAYAYRYDGLNRLTKGDYGSIATTGNVTNTSNYDLYSVGYDANGNITGLNRKNSSGTDRENLAYTYAGNQLSSLTGTYGGSSVTGKTFSYDANGNATADNLRGLTVEYFDELDLPKKYTSSDGSQYAQYTYDAAGTKWGKTVSGTGTTTLKYEGSFIYQDGALDRVLTSEGFYRSGLYHYYLKDHLGNTRMVVSYSGSAPAVEQVTEYYPFGSLFTDNNLDKNKYLYNGKELQDEFFENYDYGARFYDPELGRWHVIDPSAETYYSWSPYNYTLNNPIIYIDPNGQWVKGAGFFRNLFRSDYMIAQKATERANSGPTTTFFTGLNEDGTSRFRMENGSLGQILNENTGLYRSLMDKYGSSDFGKEIYMSRFMYATERNRMATVNGIMAVASIPGLIEAPFAIANLASGLRAAESSTALRQVGTALESVDDVMLNPSLVNGKSYAQIRGVLSESEGWVNSVMTKTRGADKGWVYRQVNASGQPTGKLIQYHPGSVRHFGGNPYWKVSNGTSTFRFPAGN